MRLDSRGADKLSVASEKVTYRAFVVLWRLNMVLSDKCYLEI